jgi:hypothetical protein
MYPDPMKLLTLAATLLVLSPIALAAQSTDAMPPEMNAPAHQSGDMKSEVKPAIKASKTLAITFRGATTNLTLTDLMSLPQMTITVRDGHTGKDIKFTGPLVSDVLIKAGLVPSEDTHQLILHSTVVATGADGYFVLYSAAELEGMFSGAKAIIAVMRFELPNTEGGLIQLVNTADVKPARWVHGLASLNVMSLAPTK